jgi:serine/threonine protein kinase
MGLPGSAAPSTYVPGYEILGELGRGGMGVVYKARQLNLKRTVALKMILAGAHAGTGELARFRAEAEAVARLQHPNIVQIFDIGSQEGLAYFSLELVEGGTLGQRLKGAPIPPDQAAVLVATLARAMDHAHRRGIVHRDLKPANVLLAVSDQPSAASLNEGSGLTVDRCPLTALTPKITDFGLAKQLEADAGQTRSGAIMGTPGYMAPGQSAR